MTRDDLYGYYRRYYVPNNATLVIVGDVEPDDVLRRVEKAIRIDSDVAARAASVERRATADWVSAECVVERPGTTAYLKLAWHAPAATDAGFLSDARARCRADRREGDQSVGELPRRPAAA